MATRITVNRLFENCYFVLIALLVFGMGGGAFASPPLPQSKAQALGALEMELDEKKQIEDILKLEVHELEAELEKTRKQLVGKAKAVQGSEAALKKLEDQISKLETDKDEVEASIQKDRQSIGRLVMALERLRRLPPEVMIARPNAPIDTARSSMLIGDIVPVLTKRAAKLRDEVAQLQETRVALEKKRAVAADRSARLNGQYAKMATLMKAREQIYKRTRGDYKAQASKVREMAKQAGSLKDLVEKLDEDKARAEARRLAAVAAKKLSSKTARPVLSVMPSQGGQQLPVSGVVLVRYGEPDSFGAKSRGVKIEGRSRALVVAPMSGIVRFSGEFKNYGNMVIIEHKNGYHSLVAGLKNIDTVVGQSIVAGEPIGKLHKSGRTHKPVLYYELRFKGNAVNPAKKFAELS